MKVVLNPMFEQASGQLGELVFREMRGKTVISRKPVYANNEPTAGQAAHRERFKQAVAYGRSVLADDNVRPLYEAVAKERNVPVFSTTIADFFNAPVIHHVDVFGYSGNIGDTISILASDDFGVAKVHVAISDDQGNMIENGEAVETAAGSGQWHYTATVQGQPVVKIQVVAMDRPGGTAVMNVNKTF
jgi:hypothetical protein